MRRTAKLALFLAVSILFLVAGPVLQLVIRDRRRWAIITSFWARTMTRIVRIQCTIDAGTALPPGTLIVANHQSYLDIIILSAAVPTLFIAKSDVGSWPLLGRLARMGGTLFVDRRSLRGGRTIAVRTAEVLQSGTNVLCFPEGTSSDGSGVLPFRPTIFSALSPGSVLQPVTVNYRTIDGDPVTANERDRILWHGTMGFTGHFWGLLRCRSITAEVLFDEPIIVPFIFDPRDLANESHSRVVSRFLPLR